MLQDLTVGQLVQRYAEMGVEQDKAEQESAYGNITKINRLFERMQAIEDELKGRSGDQRSALLQLYDHSRS